MKESCGGCEKISKLLGAELHEVGILSISLFNAIGNKWQYGPSDPSQYKVLKMIVRVKDGEGTIETYVLVR